MIFEQAKNELELIERHIAVLTKVAESGPIGILKLAEITGMQPHKVRYSLRVLEQNSLIKPSQQGAVVGNKAFEFIKTTSESYDELDRLILNIRQSEQNLIKALKANRR